MGMFVSVMAFFAKVSDPAVGGTYMTLLNTVTNLGGNWPSTLALWAVDPLTTKICQGGNSTTVTDCSASETLEACTGSGCHHSKLPAGGQVLPPLLLLLRRGRYLLCPWVGL